MKLTTVAGFLAVTLAALCVRSCDADLISSLDGPDWDQFGRLLNTLLVLILRVPLTDTEHIPALLDKIDQVVAKLLCFINGLPMSAQDHMYLLLGDLLSFIASLKENPVQAIFQEGTQIFFIIIDLLENLESRIYPDVFGALGKLLTLDNLL